MNIMKLLPKWRLKTMKKKLIISALLGACLMTSSLSAMEQITDAADTVLSSHGSTGAGFKAVTDKKKRFILELSNGQGITTDGEQPALLSAKIQVVLAKKGFLGLFKKDAIIERKINVMKMISSLLQSKEIYKSRWYNLPINYMIQLWYHNCNGMEHATGLKKPTSAQKIGFVLATFIAQATTTYGLRNTKSKIGKAFLAANSAAFIYSAVKKYQAQKVQIKLKTS
jgi:hypothetical protein